jgi:hypothetical protein
MADRFDAVVIGTGRGLRDGVFAHPTLAESLNNLFKNVKPI